MFRRLALAVAIAAAAAACSGPPTKEHQQAVDAIASARAAGAATYAPTEFRAAESALAQYDAAVAQRDYRQALRLALDARDNAYEATKLAATAKLAAEKDAERLVASVEALIPAAKARLAGTSGPRPGGRAAEELRSALKTAPAALQEARSQMATGNYRAVISALTPIEASLRAAPPATGRRGR